MKTWEGYFSVLFSSFLATTLISCSGGGSSHAPIETGTEVNISQTVPGDGAVAVPADVTLTVHFLQPVDPASVSPSSFVLYFGQEQIPAQVSVQGNTAFLKPSQSLRTRGFYRALLTTGVRSMDGGKLPVARLWSFTIEDTDNPTLTRIFPGEELQNFNLEAPIEVQFNETMDPATFNAQTVKLTGPNGDVTGDILYQEDTVFFQPSHALESSSQYSVTLDGAEIRDLAGHSLDCNRELPCNWIFYTQDLALPQVVSVNPADGSNNVILRPDIDATFSETMQDSTIHTGSFSLKDFDFGVAIQEASVFYDRASRKASLVLNSSGPFSDLFPNTRFEPLLSQDIRDASGNRLAPYSWSFQTRQGWKTATLLDSDLNDANLPAAAYDPTRGVFHVFWQQKINAETVFSIVANQVGHYVTNPSKSVVVENDAGDANTPRVLYNPANNIVMGFWAQKIAFEDKYSILFNRLLPGSNNWESPVAIDPNGTDAQNIEVALGPDGTVWATWKQDMGTNYYAIFVNYLMPGESQWNVSDRIRRIDRDEGTCDNPQIAVAPDGTVHVIWQRGNPTNIYHNRLKPGDSDWNPQSAKRVDTTPTGKKAENPRLAVNPDGTLFAVWDQTQETGDVTGIYTNRLLASDNSWPSNRVKRLEASNKNGQVPQIALASNGVYHVVWHQPVNDGNVNNIYACKVTLGSDNKLNPGNPIEIDNGSIAATLPQIAALPNGTVLAVWEQAPSSQVKNVYANWLLPNENNWQASRAFAIDWDGNTNGQDARGAGVPAIDAAHNIFMVPFRQKNTDDTGGSSIFVNQFR